MSPSEAVQVALGGTTAGHGPQPSMCPRHVMLEDGACGTTIPQPHLPNPPAAAHRLHGSRIAGATCASELQSYVF
eukprot:364938-Chlamydomonas_euryale.AAC.4